MKGKPWEYIFIVDMEGHQQDPRSRRALAEAARVSASHKILGSFPRALEVVSGRAVLAIVGCSWERR